MSKIIGFLEQAGRDAALRHATREQLLRRMSAEEIEQPLQDALLHRQRSALATLIGARETMYAQNESIEPAKKKAPSKKKPAKKKAPAKKKPAKKKPAKKKAPAKKPAKKAPKRKR